ncbi:hypothetical protein GCM10020219_052470 [Nonomuraea dietziae]
MPFSGHGDRRTVVVVVAIQAAISLGYFAAMAHVVIHLRVDLGLAAGLIGLVLALRNLVQHTLSLPVGALVDVLGPVRIGMLACLLRAGPGSRCWAPCPPCPGWSSRRCCWARAGRCSIRRRSRCWPGSPNGGGRADTRRT